jgi:hypothetical protein
MADSKTADSLPVRDWALLFYVCADLPLGPQVFRRRTDRHLAEVARAVRGIDLDRCHVLLQIDTPQEGATRWRFVRDRAACRFELVSAEPAQASSTTGKSSERVVQLPTRINTGDTAEAVDFLNWALTEGPALHNAVVISGLGISRRHVQSILQDTKSFGREDQIARFRKQNLFSICHDVSHLDALEAHELRDIFGDVTRRLGRRLDVVVLDAGLTAFMELIYQLRGLADYCVAAEGILPDSLSTNRKDSLGEWPWSSLRIALSCWMGVAPADSAEQVAQRLAEAFNAEISQHATWHDSRMVALRLKPITAAVGLLNHLTSTLLQSMGDWHVLNALLTVWRDWRPLWAKVQVPSVKGHGDACTHWDRDIDRCDVF